MHCAGAQPAAEGRRSQGLEVVHDTATDGLSHGATRMGAAHLQGRRVPSQGIVVLQSFDAYKADRRQMAVVLWTGNWSDTTGCKCTQRFAQIATNTGGQSSGAGGPWHADEQLH